MFFCQFHSNRIRESQINADPNQKHLLKRYKKHTTVPLRDMSLITFFFCPFLKRLCVSFMLQESLQDRVANTENSSDTHWFLHSSSQVRFQIVKIFAYFVWYVFCRAIFCFSVVADEIRRIRCNESGSELDLNRILIWTTHKLKQ